MHVADHAKDQMLADLRAVSSGAGVQPCTVCLKGKQEGLVSSPPSLALLGQKMYFHDRTLWLHA